MRAASTDLPLPTTQAGIELRQRVGPARWQRIVRRAIERGEVLQAARRKRRSGLSWRQALQAVAPEVSWTTFRRWRAWGRKGSGPLWERLLDERIPPKPLAVPEAVRKAVIMFRQISPRMDCATARKHLVEHFGDEGGISDSSLRRIWRSVGLTQAPIRPGDEVKHYHGGAGLAFLGAASVETGASLRIAMAALEAATRTASAQTEVQPSALGDGSGRDSHGRFTPEYNRAISGELADGECDPRFQSEAEKRNQRDLSSLRTIESSASVLSAKILAIGSVPLLTQRRGFDGLDGPQGEWLELLGGVPYAAATLDKCLAEFALLDVEDAMWYAHGETAQTVAKQWVIDSSRPWLQMVAYVDATHDPYWTTKYALSGKVPRTGRVQPCLTRIALTGGPGVPLVVETHAGTVSLKTALPRFVERLEAVVGDGELGRLLVIDAEMATCKLMSALAAIPERHFITVLKGRGSEKRFESTEEWQPYRERDSLREGTVLLHGEGAPEEGLRLRAIQMRRPSSSHPHPTLFLTDAKPEDLNAAQVAEAYLSRWPHQEQVFRNARNGAGFQCSHGYGGEWVQHVALETKLEQAQSRLQRARVRRRQAESKVEQMRELVDNAETAEAQSGASAAVKLAERERRDAADHLAKSAKVAADLATRPKEIYCRDTTRENIASVAAINMLLLVEYVLREYFDGLRIELRTFIEHFVNLPLQVIITRRRVIYRVSTNPRNKARNDQLRRACANVTARKIRRDGKKLVFEVDEPPGPN